VQTETLQVYTAFSSPARTALALEKLEAADLVVLAFPLYVDSLPAPVIAALEKIAAQRLGRSTRQRFTAIANCGFPEASHNAPALAICSEFARQSGFAWAGSLALGGAPSRLKSPLKWLQMHFPPANPSRPQQATCLPGRLSPAGCTACSAPTVGDSRPSSTVCNERLKTAHMIW
jgi:hypothetical protein